MIPSDRHLKIGSLLFEGLDQIDLTGPNLAAIATMPRKFPTLDLVLIESGGDNLATTLSPELADITIYVIDVSGGEKIPRKGGPASPAPTYSS